MDSTLAYSLFVSIPHAGEFIPEEVNWLRHLPEPVCMRDVDRFVDKLYKPVIDELLLASIVADCHRYVVDLNRLPSEFDADSVQGAPHPSGTHPKGLHWSITTWGERLITDPMSMDLHLDLVRKHYDPFHDKIKSMANALKTEHVYHLDLHSMPSQGTGMHNDPGEKRADIVVSDFHGKSSRKEFVDAVVNAYEGAGFTVAYNWPYFGGGITQTYGRPQNGHHTVQVELNRALYMDEDTKQPLAEKFSQTQERLKQALKTLRCGPLF